VTKLIGGLGWLGSLCLCVAVLLGGCSSGEEGLEQDFQADGVQKGALGVRSQRSGALTPKLDCVSEEGGQLVARFGYEYTPKKHTGKRSFARWRDDDGHDDDGHDDDGHDDDGHDDDGHGDDEHGPRSLSVPVGQDNKFTPGPADRGQPTKFIEGEHSDVVRVPFAKALTWKLLGKSVTAHKESPRCEVSGPAAVGVAWQEAPVVLVATRGYGGAASEAGSATLPEPTEFEVPARLRVQQGNAGDQRAVLSFKDEAGELVRCTYRGGARASGSKDELELAKGRYYELKHCTQGYEGGKRARARWFSLELKGGDEKQGRTAVELHLGVNACSAPLDPPILPAESVRLRRGFSWKRTKALPELDPQGNPALHHALIYVRDKEELEGLDELLIHWSPKPFFASELGSYLGRCGAIHYEGDGRGSFVFAILPAITYNLIRQGALNPDPVEGDQSLFEAVILRAPPEEITNSDGSLSWDALKSAAYLYRGLTALPDEPLQQPFWNSVKRRLARAIAQTVKSTVRVVTAGLGVIDGAITGRSTVAVDLHVLNRDPLFGLRRVMTRAWGPDAGTELRLGGVRVEVLQWSSFWLPTQFSGTLGNDGKARIRVAKGGTGRNGTICMAMKNDAATLTTFLLPTDICDFRLSAGYGQAFERDLDLDIRADNYEVHTLTQVADAHAYARAVMGYTPAHAEIAHGWLGNLLGGGNTIYAPCFSFPNIAQEAINTSLNALFGALTPIVGPVAAISGELFSIVDQVDIVMPNIARARDNRGVMVHEYGHFLLCSLLYDANPTGMTFFTSKRIFEGSEVDLRDESAILNEAFADFIAGQVVSGVNYFTPPNFAPSQNMSYCRGGLPCLEANGTGLERDGSGIHGDFPSRYEIAQAATLFHDAFDGHSWRGTNNPTNGDAWLYNDTLKILEYTPIGYGDAQDERIALSGGNIERWITFWARDFTPALVKDELYSSLARVIRGNSWCEKCQLFALHVPNGGSSMREHMQACTRGPIVNWIGGPPAPLERLSDSCQVCEADEILQAGACSPCPLGTTPNLSRTACIACGVDAILDFTPRVCDFFGSASFGAGAAGTCDAVHIVDVIKLKENAALAPACSVGEFPVEVRSRAQGRAECEAVQAVVTLEGMSSSGASTMLAQQSVSGTYVEIRFGPIDASYCSLWSASLPLPVARAFDTARVTVATTSGVSISIIAGTPPESR
jgi:hypothetical protein